MKSHLLIPLLLVLWMCGCESVRVEGEENREEKGEEKGEGKGEERRGREGRQDLVSTTKIRRLMNRGVYIPDSRFNPFVDGVMVNMVTEMKRTRMDPLYFRVTDVGEVLHVPMQDTEVINTAGFRRNQRMARSPALGGGMVKGLLNVRRFSDASVQKVGNATLVKSSWLIGPLAIIIDYRGIPTITRVITSLEAIQMNTLTTIDKFGAEKKEMSLNSPLFEYMPYYGNRTLHQQKMTELVVKYLFSGSSFLVKYLDRLFELASFDKIIPQFGSNQNHQSVLEYLSNARAGARSSEFSGVPGSFGSTGFSGVSGGSDSFGSTGVSGVSLSTKSTGFSENSEDSGVQGSTRSTGPTGFSEDSGFPEFPEFPGSFGLPESSLHSSKIRMKEMLGERVDEMENRSGEKENEYIKEELAGMIEREKESKRKEIEEGVMDDILGFLENVERERTL